MSNVDDLTDDYLSALAVSPCSPGRSDAEFRLVEEPLARQLIEGRHEIRRQVCVDGGRIDIFDETTSELIECKAVGDSVSIAAAVEQLRRYKPDFCSPQLAIAIPRLLPSAEWLRPALEDLEIRLIEMERGGTGV